MAIKKRIFFTASLSADYSFENKYYVSFSISFGTNMDDQHIKGKRIKMFYCTIKH